NQTISLLRNTILPSKRLVDTKPIRSNLQMLAAVLVAFYVNVSLTFILFTNRLVALSPVFPRKLILGMEIRQKAVQYIEEKIETSRAKHTDQFQNISVVRTNAMKYFP